MPFEASHSFAPHMEPRVLPGLGFNATAWSVRWGSVDSPTRINPVILSRESINAVPVEGEPDLNCLKVARFKAERTGFKVTDEVTIWEPKKPEKFQKQPFVCNLEDVRANPNSNDGLCGLSVVEETPGRLGSSGKEEQASVYIAYPGIVRMPTSAVSLEQSFGELPEVTILRSLGPGKNLTPIGRLYDNKETFLFRPEGKDYYHGLQVVAYDEETKEAEVVSTLEFPKTSWSKWRMGTAAGLFWLDKEHAILPIHGINFDSSATNTEGLYDYSLGVALIKKDEKGILQVVKVADKPLIVPSELDHLIGERFKFRRIAYSCYVWREGTMFNFFVSKGDLGIVLEQRTLGQAMSSLASRPEDFLAEVA